jgi:hypothetical protein
MMQLPSSGEFPSVVTLTAALLRATGAVPRSPS